MHPDMMWGAVFSVPASVVDTYLLSASPAQLRALLWIVRHAAEQPTLDALSRALQCSSEDAAALVAFWQEKGVLQTDAPQPAKPSVSAAVPTVRELPDIPFSKPSHAEILTRLQEDADLDGLFREAQRTIGRSLGYEGQCTLLMMHDTYGLPIPVIQVILQYCKETQKTANHYIAAMGKSWAAEEIDTIDKAVEKVNVLRECTGLWQQLAAVAGLSASKPTAVQSEYLRVWRYEMGFSFEMISLAYEEMANHCTKLSFAYMNKVLKNWHEKGIMTPEQVAEDHNAFRSRKAGTDALPPASYDIEKMERQLWSSPLQSGHKD